MFEILRRGGGFLRDYWRGKHQKIFAVLTAKNEELYLPTFLESIERYVDAIVALDDGSTDGTLQILERHKKVIYIIRNAEDNSLGWDERGNKAKLVAKAAELGADWILFADPDERIELRFLRRLRKFAGGPKQCYYLHFRELWDSYRMYRCDGMWNDKLRDMFFPVAQEMDYSFPHRQHTPRAYAQIRDIAVYSPCSVYHLKMIREADRVARANIYNLIDPDKKIQAIGYDYLCDDAGLELKEISHKERYDYRCVPAALKND